MDIRKLLDGWKGFVGRMNDLGIPAPTIRDPKTNEGSVSLTLVFVSSILVIIGIVGRWSGKLGGIDMGYAMQFLWTSCSLYWGRKLSAEKGKVSLGDSEEPKNG